MQFPIEKSNCNFSHAVLTGHAYLKWPSGGLKMPALPPAPFASLNQEQAKQESKQQQWVLMYWFPFCQPFLEVIKASAKSCIIYSTGRLAQSQVFYHTYLFCFLPRIFLFIWHWTMVGIQIPMNPGSLGRNFKRIFFLVERAFHSMWAVIVHMRKHRSQLWSS